jgi:hypothetical protein
MGVLFFIVLIVFLAVSVFVSFAFMLIPKLDMRHVFGFVLVFG